MSLLLFGHRLPLALLCILCGSGLFMWVSPLPSSVLAGDASDDVDCATISQYNATRTTRDFRVTLLGITKGVAFLASQDLAGDGSREHGDNTVPWIKIAVLVEVAAGRENDHVPVQLPSFDVLAADGGDLVTPVKIKTGGQSIVSRASGTASMQLDYQHLAPSIFPTAAPQVEFPESARVFNLTRSGAIKASETALIRLRLGAKPGYQEVTFEDVPLP